MHMHFFIYLEKSVDIERGFRYNFICKVKFLNRGESMDKLYIADLYPFYKNLLTDKQQEVVYMHCFEDLSLGEISELLKISRQGVYDLFKRSGHLLLEYEEKLHLYNRYLFRMKKIDKIKELLDDEDILNELESLRD